MTRARDVAGLISSVNAAGKNFLINGGFDHFQRGTSVTRLTSGQWLADRWTPALFQTGRHQRIALGYVNSDLNSPYALRVGSESVAENAGGSRMKAAQTIESINALPLAGKRVTLSYWIRFSSATFTSVSNVAGGGNSAYGSFNPYIAYYTSTTDGATASTFPNSSTGSPIANGSLPTVWTKYTITGVVPTNAQNVGVVFEFGTLGSTAVSDGLFYDLAQVQLEIGSVATNFSRAGGSFGAELALCQRYYVRYTCETGAPFAVFAPSGYAASTTLALGWTTLPTQLRTYPTALEYGGNLIVDTGSGTFAVTNVTLQDRSSTKVISANYTVASGLTAGQFATVRANNSASAYVAFGAEF
jgi:hypothetical protein